MQNHDIFVLFIPPKHLFYFINSHSTSMQMNGYNEYLFEPRTKNLIFSYSRGAEEGEVSEWRYYFDENGQCIETKTTNTDETDDGFYDKRAAKDWQAFFRTLINDDDVSDGDSELNNFAE